MLVNCRSEDAMHNSSIYVPFSLKIYFIIIDFYYISIMNTLVVVFSNHYYYVCLLKTYFDLSSPAYCIYIFGSYFYHTNILEIF